MMNYRLGIVKRFGRQDGWGNGWQLGHATKRGNAPTKSSHYPRKSLSIGDKTVCKP